MKSILGLTDENEIKQKFKETLVKSGCLKEDDEILAMYI